MKFILVLCIALAIGYPSQALLTNTIQNIVKNVVDSVQSGNEVELTINIFQEFQGFQGITDDIIAYYDYLLEQFIAEFRQLILNSITSILNGQITINNAFNAILDKFLIYVSQGVEYAISSYEYLLNTNGIIEVLPQNDLVEQVVDEIQQQILFAGDTIIDNFIQIMSFVISEGPSYLVYIKNQYKDLYDYLKEKYDEFINDATEIIRDKLNGLISNTVPSGTIFMLIFEKAIERLFQIAQYTTYYSIINFPVLYQQYETMIPHVIGLVHQVLTVVQEFNLNSLSAAKIFQLVHQTLSFINILPSFPPLPNINQILFQQALQEQGAEIIETFEYLVNGFFTECTQIISDSIDSIFNGQTSINDVFNTLLALFEVYILEYSNIFLNIFANLLNNIGIEFYQEDDLEEQMFDFAEQMVALVQQAYDSIQQKISLASGIIVEKLNQIMTVLNNEAPNVMSFLQNQCEDLIIYYEEKFNEFTVESNQVIHNYLPALVNGTVTTLTFYMLIYQKYVEYFIKMAQFTNQYASINIPASYNQYKPLVLQAIAFAQEALTFIEDYYIDNINLAELLQLAQKAFDFFSIMFSLPAFQTVNQIIG